MANPITKTITVPIAADIEPLKRQLAVLRTLCSQIGFALDTAILALDEPNVWPDAERFDASETLAARHSLHWRSCDCLADTAVCCDPTCCAQSDDGTT